VGEHGGAGHPGDALGVELVHEVRKWPLHLDAAGGDDPAAVLPGGHHRGHHRGDEQRQPATVDDLGQVGGEEGQLDAAEHDGD